MEGWKSVWKEEEMNSAMIEADKKKPPLYFITLTYRGGGDTIALI